MACSIQSMVPLICGLSSSSLSYSSVILVPVKFNNRIVKKIGTKFKVCRAMVQNTVAVHGASATYAKEMERLSAKESLLLAGTTSRDLWLSLEKAYAPHSTSRDYTLKTQLPTIEMHGDETPGAYLNRAQEYVRCTRRHRPTAFSELHALLSDHDYMLGKTRAPAASITSSFAANYGSPSMPQARQAQHLELAAQLSALRFQVSPIAPSGSQAFYGARPSNNNNKSNNNNRDNRNNSCGIGYIPSQCPNRDPSTFRTRPSANFVSIRAQSSNASANIQTPEQIVM
ncbi:nucleotide-binding alpha-beta plait domain-containing protein [Tanacetum coccineum]